MKKNRLPRRLMLGHHDDRAVGDMFGAAQPISDPTRHAQPPNIEARPKLGYPIAIEEGKKKARYDGEAADPDRDQHAR